MLVPRCQTDLISPPSRIPESPGVGAVGGWGRGGRLEGAAVATHQIQRDSYDTQCGRGHPPLFQAGDLKPSLPSWLVALAVVMDSECRQQLVGLFSQFYQLAGRQTKLKL